VVPGFVIAGKTGTAYKHDPVTKRYSTDRYLASFMGFIPADDPRLAIVVQIDEPSAGKHFGGDVAGPVFAAIASETLKYMGVPATVPVAPAPAAAAADPPEPAPEAEIDIEPDPEGDLVLIPDFGGLSVAQALALAQARGVKVEIQGSGRAVKQFPPPGRA